MKTLLMALITCVISAQTVYRVTPGTTDNKIILTVENSSDESDMTGIKAAVSKQFSTFNFQISEQKIDRVEKHGSKEVEFAFDVNRIVDVNKTDTVRFLINSNRGSWVKEILIGYELPRDFKLEQNYPNPFNPSTTIEFSLPKEGKYVVRIFNILGEIVRTLDDKYFDAGYHKILFDATELSSGVYFYALSGSKVNLVKKMILIK